MLFFALTSSHIAIMHLSMGRRHSSKMVPIFTENWRRGWFSRHSHTRRAGRCRTLVEPQCGQQTPFGQRIAAKNAVA